MVTFVILRPLSPSWSQTLHLLDTAWELYARFTPVLYLPQSDRVTESQSDRVTDTQGYSVYGWAKIFCA